MEKTKAVCKVTAAFDMEGNLRPQFIWFVERRMI